MKPAAILPALALGCGAPALPSAHTANLVEDWRDEIIYQLLTDRFADGDRSNDLNVDPNAPARYQGGDWQGVIDHLDYLQELGVTALWISPVVQNVEEDAGVAGYHGYWQQDFTRPNAHFGDISKLIEMVGACHARGIKVILDIVTNHVGQLFFYDMNLNGQPDDRLFGSGNGADSLTRVSEYDPPYEARGIHAFTSLGDAGRAPIIWRWDPALNRVPPEPEGFRNPDWYNRRGRVTNWGDLEQVVRGDFPGGLKDLDTTNPDVRAALIDAFDRWADLADFDGFRIDTLKHVEHEFWRDFCPAIRARAEARGKHKFFMFGEAFDGDDALVGSFTQPGEVDSVFYFPQKFRVIEDVFRWGGGTDRIEQLYRDRTMHYGAVAQEMGAGAPPQQLLVGFLDNHDVPRFLGELAPTESGQPYLPGLHNALFFLFTTDTIPCVYYGTEQNFTGGNDPSNRENLWTSGYDTTNPTFQLVKTLAALRKQYAPLRRGTLSVRWSSPRTGDEQDAGIFAFERQVQDDKVLVVVNTRDAHAAETSGSSMGFGDMMTTFSEGTRLRNVFPDDDPADDFTVGPGGALVVRVPPRGGKILVPEPAR